jgi:hypothetical protein
MEQAARPARRPKLVWVIFLFTLLSVGYTALSFYLIYSGGVPLTAGELKYVRDLSTIDYGITGTVGLLKVAGAIVLFRLRSAAVYLYAAALAIGILHTLASAKIIAAAPFADRPGFIQILIGFAIWAAVCVYAWRLKARGVLK